jgi:hypothetical protein
MSTSHGETAAYLYMYFFRSQYASTVTRKKEKTITIESTWSTQT